MNEKLEKIILERQAINQMIRVFFASRDYLEVETPILVGSPGMEPNLDPFETSVSEPNGREYPATLITSPEYSMKKLLGQGLEKIFTITKVFRNREEFGGQHNSEFTMLEWYSQGKDYQACMDETEELVRRTFALFGKHIPEFKRVRVKDLFDEFVGINLDISTPEDLKIACQELGIHFQEDDSESDLFYRLFLEMIEPNLGTNPIFVYDYPVYQAALAKLTDDKCYGQRFELYINGVELCNGFTELTDANEQRARFEIEAKERKDQGKTLHPIDEELLKLLPSVRTPTFGNALGIERLHMVASGQSLISDVLLFPVNRIFRK